jgi:hypothetical protein
LNGSLREHPSIGDAIEGFVAYWGFHLFVVATFSLWLLDRPCMPPLEDSLSPVSPRQDWALRVGLRIIELLGGLTQQSR